MDVLHITHQFAPETRGGVESYVADLIAEQHQGGVDVHVLTGSHVPWPQLGIEELRVGPVPVHRLHRDDLYFDLYTKAWHPGVGALIDDFLARHRPQVVHLHQWIRLTSNLVEIVQRRGIPVVVTLHDYYTCCPRAFRQRPDGSACDVPVGPKGCSDCVPRYGHETAAELAEGLQLFADQSRAELSMADAVLVSVSSTLDLVARTLALPREQFQLLPLGYRRRFPGAPPLPAPAADGPLRFAFWGGVAPHKGVAVLVAAFARLLAAPLPRPVELHLLGGFATPAFEQQLRAAAQGLPVTFHGPFATEQLRAVAPHVGVFPSTCLETFGFVLDECVELGLPCIVSDRGALPVRIGGGGLVVPAGEIEPLAGAMRRFVGEPALWALLREQLPELPPDVRAHCRTLAGIYAAAAEHRARSKGPHGGIDDARRIAFVLRQRESALANLPKDGLR